MNCEVIQNRVLIQQDELDIYDALTLKEQITSVAASNNNSVVLDLQRVEGISTPIIQILLSFKRDIVDFKILNISEGVQKTIHLFGFSL